MSCDGNRGVFFAHICATAGMGSGVTPADLEEIYERNIGNPKGFAEELANDAKTRKLFAEMRRVNITPPTHSATGLPKKPSRRGYAAIYDELKRRGWISEAEPTAGPTPAAVPVVEAVTGDAVLTRGRQAARPDLLAEEATGGVAVAAPPAAPLVAVQSKPGRIDAVAFRVNGGPIRYVWGGSWLEMKDFVKAMPGGTRKPWFRGGNVNVWELYCTEAEAEEALKGKGWQIASAKPDVSSVIRAGAAIVDPTGRELVAASPPAPELVPMHGGDGSVAWAPAGAGAVAAAARANAAAAMATGPTIATPPPAAPAAPSPRPAAPTPPPAPVKSKAQLEQEAGKAAEALLAAIPSIVDVANMEGQIQPGGQVAQQMQRWAETASKVYTTGDIAQALTMGNGTGENAFRYQYYARAICQAGGVQRCPTCQQFQAKDGSHVCPDQRFDESGFNRKGYNRRGFNKQGFNADGRDAEGYDATGFRVDPATKMEVNRRGYTRKGLRPDGTHENGYTQRRDEKGLDFYGFDQLGRDAEGYDRNGYDANGRDRNGFDWAGYDAAGVHIAGSPDANGLYSDGFDADGYDLNGFDAEGFDAWGFNRNGLASVVRGKIQRWIYKDGRDSDGMRYSFNGYDLQGYTATGYNAEGEDRNGEKRKMRSPKTGKLIRATYNEFGIDPNGFNRWGFNVNDGLSDPDEHGRRMAPNGWIFDPADGYLYDPEDPSRRMPHSWETKDVRVGRSIVRKVLSTGRPPSFTPPSSLVDGRLPPSGAVCRAVGRDLNEKRPAPAPLASTTRLDLLRLSRDPHARRNGVLLRCPYCGQFTGGNAHSCPHFKHLAQRDSHHLGASVLVAPNGVVIDASGDTGELTTGNTSIWNPGRQALYVVYNPAVPDYDPTCRFAGYDEHGRDPDGYDIYGYGRNGYNRQGYNREGFDIFGYDADGYDRNGYNRQGKNREGKQRPLTVEELRRSLAPGEEPLENEEMARHYSRLAQAITGKPVTVKFDRSVPTGATDMRGNIYLNPHPLGKEADPRRNFLVSKAIMYHEVGHELTTNPEHWAELKGIAASPEPVEGIDKGRAHILRIYNIVEDGRMEREMSDRFPGVAGTLAAAARLRDKWDCTVGAGVPTLHQVTGALLYTTLPYYRVPQEVVDKMTPEARALYEELRPIALRGALGSQEDSLEASKEIVRRLERAGVFDQPVPEQTNVEATPPGGAVGNTPPTPPKSKRPQQPEGGESGQGGSSGGEQGNDEQGGSDDEPNGRGKGWRKGQKTASDDESSEGGSSDSDEAESGQSGSSGGEQGDEGDGDGAGAGGGGNEEGQEGGESGQGGSSGGAGGSQGGQGGSSGGSKGDDGAGQEGGAGGSSGSSGGSNGGAEGKSQEGGAGGSGEADGDEPNGRGKGWRKGQKTASDDEEGESVNAEGDDGDDGAQSGGSDGAGGFQGDDGDGGEGGQGGSSGSSQGGQQSRSQSGQGATGDEGDGESGTWGDDSSDDDSDAWGDEGDESDGEGDDQAGDAASNVGSQSGNRQSSNRQSQPEPEPQRINPDAMLEPEMGEGSDNIGGDGYGATSSSAPTAVSGELFDPLNPFTDAELDAALKAADREAAQVIASQVRRQANYDTLGRRLHRRLTDDPVVQQPYRTPDGRASYVDVLQPRSTNAAHIRTLEGQEQLHRQVSGKLARQLQAIRAQTDQRVRFQTSGKLDQRRLVAAVRGVEEVRQQVKEMPATSMAVSVTLDFSGSMWGHITSGKVYNAASILGSTFEQLDVPYELRGHADRAAIFKAMEDEHRDPARMAMMAVTNNGCGGGNAETAPTMALAATSLIARPEKNKLIVSLMDGDMGDHAATVQQLADARKQGIVTFCVFLGQPNDSQKAKLSEMYGSGSWVQINDLSEMPQAVGRRLARIFESIGRK
ncbi:hypothetical protein [Chloroflexus sp.]|uniref:hypothetical protein n=1 Tax=Chloroflexus sp. TaxID=1904827 RepID=UPI002ACEE242|nr:hypothetical protein [Chloroflexus sp.]